MLEYGDTYLSENAHILEEMYARMEPEAVELAKAMAAEDIEAEEDEEVDA